MQSKRVQVEFTPEFKRNLRTLSKKYPHSRSDVEPVIDQLQKGQILGEQIAGTGHTLFKLRIKNSDIAKGKRSGYRLIYWLKIDVQIVLLTIYSKSEQGDISAKELVKIVREFERLLVEEIETEQVKRGKKNG
jgi:addiction module RelE/StbE family toxin